MYPNTVSAVRAILRSHVPIPAMGRSLVSVSGLLRYCDRERWEDRLYLCTFQPFRSQASPCDQFLGFCVLHKMKFHSLDKWVQRVPFESTQQPPESDDIPDGQPDLELEASWEPVSLSDDCTVSVGENDNDTPVVTPRIGDDHDDGIRSPILADYTMTSLMNGASGSDGPSVTGTDLLKQVNAMISFENAARPDATGKKARRLKKKETKRKRIATGKNAE